MAEERKIIILREEYSMQEHPQIKKTGMSSELIPVLFYENHLLLRTIRSVQC